MTWFYTLASVIVVSLVSLVGVVFLVASGSKLRQWLSVLVALAAGALFGDVLIHIIPEIFRETETPALSSLAILVGILLFFILEKFLYWSHTHGLEEECINCDPPRYHRPVKPVGHLVLVSDAVHNLIDGIIIGISYLVSLPVGLATTVAVILHEIPQEIGDFAILVHAGFTKSRALLFNLFSASLAIIGAVLALLLGQQSELVATILLPIAAGGFLYIAGSDLVPELHEVRSLRESVKQLAALLLGIGLMFILLLWE